MTIAFPEFLVSLTIQCTVLLCVTRFLVNRTRTSQAADDLWSFCHLMILLLSLAGILLPHARLFRGASLLSFCHQATALPIPQSLWMALFWIWISVSVALAANMLRSLIEISLLLRRAKVLPRSIFVDDRGNSESSSSLADDLQNLEVRVVKSESCETPFCWQLHRPVIVLPESLCAFPVDELRAVVRHELAHLKARHPLKLFLQRLVEMGFWFHPLVWQTSHAAALLRELSADCQANRTHTEAASFLRSLVRLSESACDRPPVLSIGLNLISDGASMIERRVEQLLATDWALPQKCDSGLLRAVAVRSFVRLSITAMVVAGIWIPLNSHASGRTLFSPWPMPTATLLQEAGFEVRDYELDSHRIVEHSHDAD